VPGLINSTNYKFNLNNYFILTKTKHIMCYVFFDVKMSLNIMMCNI
jgi:hypothetical protein